jgi:hypothetical protein
MRSRFIVSFLTAFVLTLSVLGGLGWAVWTAARVTARAPGEQFLSSYFEFDLAPGWSCELDGTEYVCQPAGKPPFPAIAIIAMKERNNQDRLEDYETHLRTPQLVTMKNGETRMSEVRFVKRTSLGGKQWVEALHAGSELPNFLTYYLATTTSALGILVTMSVHKDSVDKYRRQLDDMMSSLTVYQR